MRTENPIKSLEMCMIFHPRDWGADKRDAWIYGIVVGWDDESLEELQEKFNIEKSEINRLKRLHEQFISIA